MSGGNMFAQIPGFMYNEMDGTLDGNPVNLDQSNDPFRTADIGPVAKNVTHVDLQLANGTLLTLHPVAFRGQRWVGVMLPTRLPLLNVIAYARTGEIAHAIPFNGGVVGWLKPGQPGAARATIKVASGVTGGHRWSAYAYVGPWGRCFMLDSSGGCDAGQASLVPKGKLVAEGTCSPGPGNTRFELASAALPVRSLRLQLADGSVIQVRPVVVGKARSFGFPVPVGTKFTGWTAYGAGGQPLGSGSGQSWAC